MSCVSCMPALSVTVSARGTHGCPRVRDLPEELEVHAGHVGPGHGPAEPVSPILNGEELFAVREQAVDRARDRFRVTEGHDNPPTVGEKLLGISEGGGDDSLAAADRVGQRSTDNLILIEVGHDVDVGSSQIPNELRVGEESVIESNMPQDAEVASHVRQLIAVCLALSLPDVRVCLADDEIERLRLLLDNGGQRLDDVFDCLTGADEPEGREERAISQSEDLLGAPANRLL